LAPPLNTTIKLPAPEQVIGGRYRLGEQLGAGGMGLVFKAQQLGVGNWVAVKFLDPEMWKDETRVKRFIQEAKVSLTIAHPGAAQLLDAGRDEQMGLLYLVFEYVEGEDLRNVLRREGRLGFDEAKDVMLKVAEVLAFAHERGVVHRDVKPENIRLRRDFSGTHVRVLDFGIARLMHAEGVRLTAEGQLAGTPRYMAPEQVDDSPIDARTDIYALGLVLFEMFAGRPPFTARNMAQVLWQQLNEAMPSVAAVVPDAPAADIDALLQKACAKKPDARFRTMEAFAMAVKALPARQWPPPPSPGTGEAEPSVHRRPQEASTHIETTAKRERPELAAPPPVTVPPPRTSQAATRQEPSHRPSNLAAAAPEPETIRPARADVVSEARRLEGRPPPPVPGMSQPLADPTAVRPVLDVANMATNIKPVHVPRPGLPPELLVTVQQEVRVPPARRGSRWLGRLVLVLLFGGAAAGGWWLWLHR
jgi:serine/threonine protein kinase